MFRLTQDEYKRLQKACSSTGAHSISDFTRRELLDKAAAAQPDGIEDSPVPLRETTVRPSNNPSADELPAETNRQLKRTMRTRFFSLCFLCPLLMMSQTRDLPLPTQPIGIDDLVSLSVYRSPELSVTVRVDSTGAIDIPLLKEPVHAAGLMPKELERAIATALVTEGILVNPIVKVTMSDYASRPISVMGAVHKPLTFQAVGRVTLLDALAKAEGLAPHAAEEILVTLPKSSPDIQALVRRIPVSGLIDSANPELNLVLTGGEEIRVPEAGKVFVVGNVKKPGAYPFADPKDATLLRLLAVAEGLAPYAQKLAFIYRQEPDTGIKREIPVELSKIMKREAPDIPLQINDILYIPDNPGKRATMNVIDRALVFGAATASGVLIWR